jgi:hypothetical protein
VPAIFQTKSGGAWQQKPATYSQVVRVPAIFQTKSGGAWQQKPATRLR